jgi:glycosyltransferase involved in cell wall biosynthesis
MPLRIAYDHWIFTNQAYGGISRYFAELIRRMALDRSTQVCTYMGPYINRYGLEDDRPSFWRFGGWRRPDLPKTHRLATAIGDWCFARFVKRCEPAVYHSTFHAALARRTPMARVITVHDMNYVRAKIPPRVRDTIRDGIQRADGIICVSEFTKRDLLDFVNVPERKIRVIHHGNSLQRVPGGPRPVEESYLLFVGPRHAYKNFDVLLRAYTQSPKVRRAFRLVCFGGKSFTPAELELASRLGVSDRVTHFSGRSDEALAAAYTHAAALVYPSLYEGFGMPLLEAMGRGCPVICSNASSLPEVGGDAAAYFDPASIDQLVAKLEAVLFDQALTNRLRAAGLARESHFSWEKCAALTLQFYRELT